MARLPRITIPGIAHHVTQQGNRRQRIFIEENDYVLDRIDGVSQFLESDVDPVLEFALTKGQAFGRPLIRDEALTFLEKELKRHLRPTHRSPSWSTEKAGWW